MKDYFTEEIGEIRKFVVEDPTYSELSDEKLRERISNMLERRIHQCELDDEEKASYYSSISFKAKKGLTDAVFESIRGLVFRINFKVQTI